MSTDWKKTFVDGGLISDNDWFIWPGAADDPQRPAEPDYAWQPRRYGRYCPTPTALSLSCYWLNIRNGIVRLHDAARAVSWSTKVGAKPVTGWTGRLSNSSTYASKCPPGKSTNRFGSKARSYAAMARSDTARWSFTATISNRGLAKSGRYRRPARSRRHIRSFATSPRCAMTVPGTRRSR